MATWLPAGDGVTLFDWTDAAITFPVLDAALLARSVGDRLAPAVTEAYAAVWRQGYAARSVRTALALAPLVNTAYQAVSYEAINRAQEPRSRWEVGGIVARSLRELGGRWNARDKPRR